MCLKLEGKGIPVIRATPLLSLCWGNRGPERGSTHLLRAGDVWSPGFNNVTIKAVEQLL